jgi:hypothetical protein
MDLERISRRSALRLAALGGLAGSALAGLAAPRTTATSADTFHAAVGVWENLAPRIEVAGQAFHNQFALLVGGTAIFASPPFDIEPGDEEQYSGPFYGVWEADGPTSIAFSVRHGLYNDSVMVTGFEDMWGTATVSSDGGSIEVIRTFEETDADGNVKYNTTRTATFVRQTLRRSPTSRTNDIRTPGL